MRRGVRSHVRYADLAGHLTSAGMALQYYPVDIPIRTRLVLLLAIVMAGGFLFFPSQGTSLSSDSFYSAAVFPCTENTPEPCPVPLVLSPEGGKRFGAFRSRGGRHILLMNVPPPVRPVWNGGTPSAHSWRCRATVSAREYSCGEAAFYQPFPYSPVDGFLVTLVPVRPRRFERPDWSSPFCSIATAFSIFWGRSVYVS